MRLPCHHLDILFKKVFIEDNENNVTNEQTYSSFFHLCNPEEAIKQEIIPRKTSVAQKIFKLAGGIIGAFGMTCVYPLAKAAVDSALHVVNLHKFPAVVNVSSWAATLTAASLMAYGTGDSFGKLYNAVTSVKSYIPKCEEKNYTKIDATIIRENRAKRVIVAMLALVMGAAAGGTQAEISMEFLGTKSLYGIAALVCSSLAVSSTNFWAVDSFLMSKIKKRDIKAILNNKLQKVKDIVPSLNNNNIDNLFNFMNS